jgi:hypothetical protein
VDDRVSSRVILALASFMVSVGNFNQSVILFQSLLAQSIENWGANPGPRKCEAKSGADRNLSYWSRHNGGCTKEIRPLGDVVYLLANLRIGIGSNVHHNIHTCMGL